MLKESGTIVKKINTILHNYLCSHKKKIWCGKRSNNSYKVLMLAVTLRSSQNNQIPVPYLMILRTSFLYTNEKVGTLPVQLVFFLYLPGGGYRTVPTCSLKKKNICYRFIILVLPVGTYFADPTSCSFCKNIFKKASQFRLKYRKKPWMIRVADLDPENFHRIRIRIRILPVLWQCQVVWKRKKYFKNRAFTHFQVHFYR